MALEASKLQAISTMVTQLEQIKGFRSFQVTNNQYYTLERNQIEPPQTEAEVYALRTRNVKAFYNDSNNNNNNNNNNNKIRKHHSKDNGGV
jgi:type IV secretory pathway VirB6-like protein